MRTSKNHVKSKTDGVRLIQVKPAKAGCRPSRRVDEADGALCSFLSQVDFRGSHTMGYLILIPD